MITLYTVGYEGLTSGEFFDLLDASGIETLVDVRDMPRSRKAGFSKKLLASTAESNGIAYLHMRQLGSPGPMRTRYHSDHNWETFSAEYSVHLETQDPAMSELADLVTESRCCLMCYETEASLCHRSVITGRLPKFLTQSLTCVDISPDTNKTESGVNT